MWWVNSHILLWELKVLKMKIINDEKAQGSAELILLFGGVIVIAIVAAVYYKNYLSGLGNQIKDNDLNRLTNSIKGLNNKF
jgi:hypothetical protein